MKNITVSVSEKVYRQARIKAAERDTSVSAVVREFLIAFGGDETDFSRRKRLQDEVISSIVSFRGGDREPRQKLYERRALP